MIWLQCEGCAQETQDHPSRHGAAGGVISKTQLSPLDGFISGVSQGSKLKKKEAVFYISGQVISHRLDICCRLKWVQCEMTMDSYNKSVNLCIKVPSWWQQLATRKWLVVNWIMGSKCRNEIVDGVFVITKNKKRFSSFYSLSLSYCVVESRFPPIFLWIHW